MEPLFSATVPGTPIPQSRPRVTRDGRVYHGARSTNYRRALVLTLRTAIPWRMPALSGVAVELRARGLRANSDLDNLAKQVLDALVDAGVLAGDSVRHVRALSVTAIDDGEPRVEVAIRSI